MCFVDLISNSSYLEQVRGDFIMNYFEENSKKVMRITGPGNAAPDY